MKVRISLFIFLVIFSLGLCAAQAQTIKIGKVDLGLVISIHPHMSLFDFDRMGFFKISAGLTQAEFQQKLEQLRSAPVDRKLAADQQRMIQQIRDLDKKKAGLLEAMVGVSSEQGRKIEAQLKELAAAEKSLRDGLHDIEYQQNCPDLTPPEQTRKRLDSIENEVLAELGKLVKEKGYDLVLNSSITVPFNYRQRYKSGALFGLGVPGVDFSLFYAFLANKEHVLPTDENPESRNLINWLELINHPDALSMLPLKPYPLVLAGGDDLSNELVARIYRRHNIDEKVLDSVMSILGIIRQHDEKFDTDLESLVAPK